MTSTFGLASFHEAVVKGQVDKVKMHIQNRERVNEENAYGRTYLHEAAKYGHKAVVDLLISSNARIDGKDRGEYGWDYQIDLFGNKFHQPHLYCFFTTARSYLPVTDIELSHGWTPLHESIINMHADVVELLISKGCDVNARGLCGWTPLHCASEASNPEFVKMLLDSGAIVNTDLKFGWTALHSATAIGNIEIIELLIKAGADANVADIMSRTPLTLAYNSNNQDALNLINENLSLSKSEFSKLTDKFQMKFNLPSADEFWLKFQAPNYVLPQDNRDIEAKGCDGFTGFMRAIRSRNFKIAEELINEGADINARCYHGKTVLHHMVMLGRIDEISFLLSAGVDKNPLDKGGRTPLHLAVMPEFARLDEEGEIVRTLIDNGADINSTNNSKWTPLHLATRTGNRKAVELLVNSGADLSAKTKNGSTPLQLAKSRNLIELTEFLSEKSLTENNSIENPNRHTQSI